MDANKSKQKTQSVKTEFFVVLFLNNLPSA